MLLIIFSNATLSAKFKKLAQNKGFSGVRIIQTPKELSHTGCSYAVKAPEKYENELFSLMNEYAMLQKSVYLTEKLTNGKISYKKIK